MINSSKLLLKNKKKLIKNISTEYNDYLLNAVNNIIDKNFSQPP